MTCRVIVVIIIK